MALSVRAGGATGLFWGDEQVVDLATESVREKGKSVYAGLAFARLDVHQAREPKPSGIGELGGGKIAFLPQLAQEMAAELSRLVIVCHGSSLPQVQPWHNQAG